MKTWLYRSCTDHVKINRNFIFQAWSTQRTLKKLKLCNISTVYEDPLRTTRIQVTSSSPKRCSGAKVITHHSPPGTCCGRRRPRSGRSAPRRTQRLPAKLTTPTWCRGSSTAQRLESTNIPGGVIIHFSIHSNLSTDHLKIATTCLQWPLFRVPSFTLII